MLQIALTQVRAWTDASDAHLAHVSLHRFAIRLHPFTAQLYGDAT
jgi:hypothetical protein